MSGGNKAYEQEVNRFIKFAGSGNVTANTLHDFAKWMQKNVKNANTATYKWAAVIDYLKSRSNWKMEDIVKETAWVEYLYFPIANGYRGTLYKVTDDEFKLLIDAASYRDELIMRAIRETNMRVSELCDLKITDDILKADLKRRIMHEYQGDMYLFCQKRNYDYFGNKKKINRTYVTNRIAHYGEMVLGRRISAE